jgi:hypothetical protein
VPPPSFVFRERLPERLLQIPEHVVHARAAEESWRVGHSGVFSVFAKPATLRKVLRNGNLPTLDCFQGGKMAEANDSTEQTKERIDVDRGEALSRLAKYTAPAMLAVLMAASRAEATVSSAQL